jgi:hypothetical protein
MYHDAPMHNRLDQYTKNLLRDALSLAFKQPETEVEVLAATQKIDVYATPDPARETERKQLGLLGELSAEPSMFEAFSDTPCLGHMRRCLCKQLSWHHELERRARLAAGMDDGAKSATSELPEIVPFPRLVVVGPGRPETVLSVFGGKDFRPGVYELVEGLCTYVVVAAELPRTRETLLFRLMGGKRVLGLAIADLMALPKDAWELNIAMPLLLHFRFDVEQSVASDEGPMSAEIRAWFEDYKDKLRVEGKRAVLLDQIRVRFGEVPASTLTRIEGADATRIKRWCERVLSAQSLADVFDEAN